MAEARPVPEKPSHSLLHGAAAAFGACLFGLFINSGMPWSLLAAVALLVTALTIAHSFFKEMTPAKILGLPLFLLRR